MFRIRRIFDDNLELDKEALCQVQNILRDQFPLISQDDIDKLPAQLKNPLKFNFRTTLFVADNLKGKIQGFASLLFFSDLNFCYLDFMSASKLETGRGIGSALYERTREEALTLKSLGLYMECLPDDPALCRDPNILKQNRSRLKFYERYGARPIINTKYETPLKEEDDNPPYLVFDNLGQNISLDQEKTKLIVKNILERKYKGICSREYVDLVLASFKDNPIQLREYRYIKQTPALESKQQVPDYKKIALVVADTHEIHHIHERGYVESPVRITSIMKEIHKTNLFVQNDIKHYSEKHIESVHNRKLINYFKAVCKVIKPEQSVYPYVFPIRNQTRPPKELPMRAGYFCIDTFTPINAYAFQAAKRAVDCALTAADCILTGARIAYALVRPPGHHAESNCFGGFCYFNSAAVVAQYLCLEGKVAILDIDYHHGNGQQQIFYQRNDILTISIHGHPKFAYPFFTGFEDERGEGIGLGCNYNFPLAEKIPFDNYKTTLAEAIKLITRFNPKFLVICLGLDAAKGDPTGTWEFNASDYNAIGQMIGDLKKPVICIQEGGYNTKTLGTNAKNFFQGLWTQSYA